MTSPCQSPRAFTRKLRSAGSRREENQGHLDDTVPVIAHADDQHKHLRIQVALARTVRHPRPRPNFPG